MATGLWRFWHQRGPLQEGRGIIERLLDMPDASTVVRGRAHRAAGRTRMVERRLSGLSTLPHQRVRDSSADY